MIRVSLVLTAVFILFIPVGCLAQDDQQLREAVATAEPEELGPLYYEQWQKLTEGENLASGLEFKFNLPCNWYICQEGENGLELTDGELNMTEKYTIWFSRDVAAWTGTDRVNLWVDLGQAQPIDRVVVRVQGRPLNAPRIAEIYASDDGETWQILNTYQQGPIDAEGAYYLPQAGAYVFPLAMEAKVKARYVGMRLFLWSRHLVIDEIAVMKGADELPALAMADKPEKFFHQQGIAPFFVRDVIPVTADVGTLTYLHYNDPGLDEEADLKIVWDLPPEVELQLAEDSSVVKEQIIRDGVTYNRYMISPNRRSRRAGALFPRASARPGTESRSYLGASVNGEIQNMRLFPLQVIEFPNATPPKRLHTSLCWGGWFTYPHDPALHKRLGLNAIGCFPRYWGKDWWKNPETAADQLADLKLAQDAGIDVVMNLGYVHALKAEETRCVLPDGPAEFLCPSYRGEKYQELLGKMVGFYERINPRWLFYDIELWGYRDPVKMETCSRCKKRFEQGNYKDFADFLAAMGTEMIGDVYKAWEAKCQELGRPPFHVGFYDVYRWPERVYHNVWDFDRLYPGSLHLAMPSLYVGGRAEQVAAKISGIRALMDANDIIPWLTPGQDGEFPPAGQRDQILEAFCNGARGITYYWAGQTDPLELKVIAETIDLVRPFEDIVVDGKPIQGLSADSEKVKLCGMALGDEALVLVSCYKYRLPQRAIVSFAGEGAVYDADAGVEIPRQAGGAFPVSLQDQQTGLYYIGPRYKQRTAE